MERRQSLGKAQTRAGGGLPPTRQDSTKGLGGLRGEWEAIVPGTMRVPRTPSMDARGGWEDRVCDAVARRRSVRREDTGGDWERMASGEARDSLCTRPIEVGRERLTFIAGLWRGKCPVLVGWPTPRDRQAGVLASTAGRA